MGSRFLKSFVLLLLQFTWVSCDVNGRSDMEKAILQNLFVTSKFHMYVRPDRNVNQTAEDPMEVRVSLYIINMDVDIKKQEVTVRMYFRQEWNDSRLSYKDEGKINVLSIHDAVGLWTPDLFFVNEKFGQLHTLTKPNLFVRVYPQGQVLYSERVTVKFACPMDLRKYPFDTQICAVPIESYGYTASDLLLKWKPDTTFGTYEPPGFKVSYSTSEVIIQLAVNNYSRVELGIHLTRLIYPQLIHVYVPLGLLLVASWVSFWLRPSDRVLRLTTIVTVTIVTFMFLQSVKEFFYRECYLTALDVWVGFSCLLLVTAFFENIHVLANHDGRPPTDSLPKKKEVPELGNDGKRKLMDILAGKVPEGDSKVDAVARMMFPSVFVLFNIIYLAYYLI